MQHTKMTELISLYAIGIVAEVFIFISTERRKLCFTSVCLSVCLSVC